MSKLLGTAYKLRNAANRTTRMDADVALLCEYAIGAADTMEAEHTRLRDELREMQELCDDLRSSVIAAAFLAPHGNGAKALLEEAMERMAVRARRKVGAGETATTPSAQAHYPEEWGPSDNRRLTCVCGDSDPFHATKTPNDEAHRGARQGASGGADGSAAT